MIIKTKKAKENKGGPDSPLIATVQFPDGSHISLYSTFGEIEQLNAFADTLQILPETAHAIEMQKSKAEQAYRERDAAIHRRKHSESKLEHFLSGGRIFGRALVVMTENGGCWLQDPEKRDAGIGFYFESLLALWQSFPDLRPVKWENGELLVESVPYRPES